MDLDNQNNICPFCNSKKKNYNSFVNHRIRCKLNPDRKIQQGGGNKNPWNRGLTKEVDPRVTHLKKQKKNLISLIKPEFTIILMSLEIDKESWR